MRKAVFDIETGPQSIDRLQGMIPEFDPETVKTGNMGEEKAKEKIEKARAEHMTRFQRTAALSAITGEILAIGIMREVDPGKPPIVELLVDREDLVLRSFFQIFTESQKNNPTQWVGFYIRNFDLPFIIRRAWKHGIGVPDLMLGRYLPIVFTDLFDTWRLCEYPPDRISLDTLARFFEIGMKTGDGAQFHELLRFDREAALQYLRNDLWLAWKLAASMGAFWTPDQAKTVSASLAGTPRGIRAEPSPEEIQFY
jgi:hypothetical protein